jgi:uncharacterized membrane protein YfcA
MVPLLVAACGLTQHQAHATSLAAIVPIGAAGAIAFGIAGDIDLQIAGLLTAGTLVGAPLGAKVMARLDERPLRLAFAFLTLAIGILLLWS